MSVKYIPNFNGSIGEYIKLLRKIKKINSIELSKSIGKSDAYISQIENGRNKKPDYSTLYNVLKILGIEEEKIEDYLYHFGILSPERIAHEEELLIARMNPSEEDLKAMQEEAEYWNEVQEREMLQQEIEQRFNSNDKKYVDNTGNELLEDMLKEQIKSINTVLYNMTEYDLSNAYNTIRGLSDTLNEISTNKALYKFFTLFFSEKHSSLDNEALTKVLNTLYEELNRIDAEKIAFGKPRQRKLIKSL